MSHTTAALEILAKNLQDKTLRETDKITNSSLVPYKSHTKIDNNAHDKYRDLPLNRKMMFEAPLKFENILGHFKKYSKTLNCNEVDQKKLRNTIRVAKDWPHIEKLAGAKIVNVVACEEFDLVKVEYIVLELKTVDTFFQKFMSMWPCGGKGAPLREIQKVKKTVWLKRNRSPHELYEYISLHNPERIRIPKTTSELVKENNAKVNKKLSEQANASVGMPSQLSVADIDKAVTVAKKLAELEEKLMIALEVMDAHKK